jgi:hypothetical protein
MEINNSKRVAKNFRLMPEAVQMLKDLAAHYNTTEGLVVETMLNTYGPKILLGTPSEKRRKA